jgi:hypothetical protein
MIVSSLICQNSKIELYRIVLHRYIGEIK